MRKGFIMSQISERLAKTLGIVDNLNIEQGEELIPVDAIVAQYPDLVKNVSPAQFSDSNNANFTLLNIPSQITEIDTDIKADYIHSRNIHYTLAELVGEAMQRALELVRQTEHPKAFDSFNQLANTMLKVADQEMKIQKVYADATKEKQVIQNQTVYNTQINTETATTTLMSTTDVINMLEEEERKKDAPSLKISRQKESLYKDRIRSADESVYILDMEVDEIKPAEELPKKNGRPRKGAVRH
jgi:hypothetical protein